MCRFVEDERNSAAKEVKIACALNLISLGTLSLENIAKAMELPLEEVEKLAAKQGA